LKPCNEVGVVGYGAALPRFRIKASEIARVWGRGTRRFPVEEKAVAGPDEDVVTIATEAARYALRRSLIDPSGLGAVIVGTESKPYAVKSSGPIVAEAIGAPSTILAADYEFACKAGTEAFQTGIGLVGSKMVKYAMAIGADTAQGRPGDELELTAAAGGAAFIFALRGSASLAYLEGSYSFVTDTPDFWRRERQAYPRHSGRFTEEPAYFKHITSSVTGLLQELGLRPSDFKHAVFHQPNSRLPVEVGERLGFSPEALKAGLLAPEIGNTYAGATPLALSAVLDIASPGERILAASFGSGAGSDAFVFIVQDAIIAKRELAPSVSQLMANKRYVDYALYARYRGKISR
jgi:hydroxymethylglutaryl-CoA synthase